MFVPEQWNMADGKAGRAAVLVEGPLRKLSVKAPTGWATEWVNG
jgi:hypothetical protein